MPSFFRQKPRSTIIAAGTPPLGTPPLDVTVEPLALHKLRTLLHRGSWKSMRLGVDDQPMVHSASVQLGLDTTQHANPPSSICQDSDLDIGCVDMSAEDFGRRKVDAPEMPALPHQPEAEAESVSAGTTPPTEVSPPLPELQQPQPSSAPVTAHPVPLYHQQLSPPSPQPHNDALGLSSMAPSPNAIRPPMITNASSSAAMTRPPLTVDTGVGPGEHTLSPYATPISPAPSVPSPEQLFSTPSEHPTASALPVSDAPPSPIRAIRAGSIGDPMHVHIPARRRSSAVSTTSVHSAVSMSSPRRMAAVLQSPPMPIPIANLPSLIGGSAASPAGWGSLALEGGPRSPALSRTNSRASATGFPFTPAPTLPEPPRSNSKELTDEEVRRATKSMPVMLRVPSRQPESENDDGEAEDEEDNEDDEGDSTDDLERSTVAALSHAPPPAQSAYLHKASRALASMEPVTEESRANTPLPGASTPASSVPSPRPHRGPGAGYFEHDRPSSVLDTPSSLGLHSAPWSAQADDASSVEESVESMSTDDAASGSVAPTSIATPASLATPPLVARRPSLYTQLSQSMVNLSTPVDRPTVRLDSPDPLQTVNEADPATTPALDRDWALPPTTPWGVTPSPLKRRLSAGDADPPPPKYESVRVLGHDGPVPKPREEEGRENLPPYWCGVHIEGTLARKMEFMLPGVQAKDRGWKKYYFVLHGTALFVYKFDPSKVPLRAGEPYLRASERESQQFLHVHLAPDHHRASMSHSSTSNTPKPMASIRRATVGQEAALRTNVLATAISNARRGTIGSHTPTKRELSAGEEKDPALFPPPATNRRQSSGADSVASSTASAPIASHMPFAHNQLLHIYSMCAAESGLAADYKKRLHCVRVRAEGQQFMLQTDTARQCVQWIEAFQAATNVAMDLDTRPMPVQQTLPRRRRRGARRTTTTAVSAEPPVATAGETTAAAAFDDTPEGNIAAVIAAERDRDRVERDRDRMLEEDQAAESQGRFRI